LASWKRFAALLFGSLLLFYSARNLFRFEVRTTSWDPWLVLVGVPVGLFIVRTVARRENVAFGAWQDYLWGGLIGAVGALVLHALLSKSPLPEAIGSGVANGALIGTGLGFVVSGARGSWSPLPSPHFKRVDSPDPDIPPPDRSAPADRPPSGPAV
jgi:hypothetical protein